MWIWRHIVFQKADDGACGEKLEQKSMSSMKTLKPRQAEIPGGCDSRTATRGKLIQAPQTASNSELSCHEDQDDVNDECGEEQD